MAEWLWLGGISPAMCVACPQWDVLPGLLLLSDWEDTLFVAGMAAVPLLWARRGDSWDNAWWGDGGRRVKGPEMLCEELAGRGNPAAFPLPLQWFPSGTAVTSPEPCSSSSRSGSATQQCHKEQVSAPNVLSSLGLKVSSGCAMTSQITPAKELC